MTEQSTAIKECTTGRCAYGEPCECDYYSTWPTEKSARINTSLRHPGKFYLDGHRAGRSDACRRLWSHLNPEGRQLATSIATEGDDAHD